MGLFSRIDRHSDLLGRMAHTVGADLVAAGICGAAPETAFRTAVYGCMKCTRTEACETWLSTHSQGAERTPEYCRNKALLERLGHC